MLENVTELSVAGYVLNPDQLSRVMVNVCGIGDGDELEREVVSLLDEEVMSLEDSLLSSVEKVSELEDASLELTLVSNEEELDVAGIVQLDTTAKVIKLKR